MVTLKKAGSADIQEIWQMQRQAFAGLLEKYQDYDTNPGAEGIDRIRYRFEQAGSVYYFIMEDGVKTGVMVYSPAGLMFSRSYTYPVSQLSFPW